MLDRLEACGVSYASAVEVCLTYSNELRSNIRNTAALVSNNDDAKKANEEVSMINDILNLRGSFSISCFSRR